MMDLHAITPGTCVVRNTAARKGRTQSIAPGMRAHRAICTTAGSFSTPAHAAMRIRDGRAMKPR